MARASDEEQKAKLLARDIVFALQLYHSEEIDAAAPEMTSLVDQHRRTFQSQVPSELHSILEDALAASRLAPWRVLPGGAYRAPPPPPAVPAQRSEVNENARFVAMFIMSLVIMGTYVYLQYLNDR